MLVPAMLLQALSYCDEDFMLQLHGPHLDKAEEITNPVFLNMAAVQLRTGDYATAAHNATQVGGWIQSVADPALVTIWLSAAFGCTACQCEVAPCWLAATSKAVF